MPLVQSAGRISRERRMKILRIQTNKVCLLFLSFQQMNLIKTQIEFKSSSTPTSSSSNSTTSLEMKSGEDLPLLQTI